MRHALGVMREGLEVLRVVIAGQNRFLDGSIESSGRVGVGVVPEKKRCQKNGETTASRKRN
jgi:hypothetical protein